MDAPGVDLMELAGMLSAALGAEVDVNSLEDPPIPLLRSLIRDSIVVHEGIPGAGAQWRARVLITLETDGPWYERMQNAWLKRVAEQGL